MTEQHDTEQIRDLEKLVHRNRELLENGRSIILQIDQRIRCDDSAATPANDFQPQAVLQ